MEILRLLEQHDWIDHYEVQDFRQLENGLYYRLKITFIDQSVLFAREYVDEFERTYSFHWQDKYDMLIIRWDNAPHHRHISTFPHHKHMSDEVVENSAIALAEVLEAIRKEIGREGQ